MDMLTVDEARRFATIRHGSQKYGDHPYTHHLGDVVLRVADTGFTEWEMLAAAWLHDVVEDTSTTLAEIEQEFGLRVAALVYAVTSEPGRNRKERNAATYPKLRAAGSSAVALKLCDRISNVEACWRTGDTKLFMYHREYRDFRTALRREDNDPRVLKLWDTLDKRMGWYEPSARISL